MADDAATPTPSTPPESGTPASPKPATAAESLAAQALAAAQAAVSQLDDPVTSAAGPQPTGTTTPPSPAGATPLPLPDFDADAAPAPLPQGIDLLADVNLQVKIELGRTRMLVEDVLKLNAGAVVELDKLAGDPVDIYVNERPVARGEVLVLNDNFCVRINEILSPAAAERIANRGRSDGPARAG